MPATRNQRAQRPAPVPAPVPVAVPPARRPRRARVPRSSGTTSTVRSLGSATPAPAAPLQAPASVLTPQQIQEIVSTVTIEVTRRLQNAATPVPGVDNVPWSSSAAAAVTESPIVQAPEHVATPTTTVAQRAVQNALGSAHAASSGETNPTMLAPHSSCIQPTQDFQSISLPIDCRISVKLKNKIWNDEYINFGSLLGNPMSENKFQLSFSASDTGLPPSLSVEPMSKSKKSRFLVGDAKF